jgi:hypothetical protein
MIFPDLSPWVNAVHAWLLTNTGWLQVVAAFLAVPATVYGAVVGAKRGARLAYELSEKSALDREARAAAEEEAALKRRMNSMRLLLSLEVQRNLDDLGWLRKELVDVLGKEDGRYWESGVGEAERLAWFEARQRFVSLYMPDWSHSFWHGQQSSHLLPEALGPEEIRQLNFFHSQLDRLTKLKDMLAERTQRDADAARPAAGGDVPRSCKFGEEAPILWKDFTETMSDLLDSPPTLAPPTPVPAGAPALADAPSQGRTLDAPSR